MVLDTHWNEIPDDYSDHAGFVYKIVNNLSGKAYIGRKYFYKKTGKAQIESDWKIYTSSSADVNADIKKFGKENFSFFVLALCKDKIETNYLEVSMQIEANVLLATNEKGELAFYNKNIMSKYFQVKEAGTPEHKQKCENISKALKELHAKKNYVHPMKGKVHPNKGKTMPQTAPKAPHLTGMFWFTNGEQNVAYKKDDTIPEGFYRGLTMRKPYHNTVTQKLKSDYAENPSYCVVCKKQLSFAKKKNLTCSIKCQNKKQSEFGKEFYKEGLSAISKINNPDTPEGKAHRKTHSETMKKLYASEDYKHPLLGKTHPCKGKKRAPKAKV